MKIRTLIICGPTCAGKTEYAIRAAEALGGEIVSADSMQIYRFMDIGSAKPTAEELSRARHHLVDFTDPRQPFSVHEYKLMAEECIKDIASRGRLPIVCGGTGLYINSLVYDMRFDAPEGEDSFREKLSEKYPTPKALHDRLRELDPDAADEIHENNVKRVLRAVERLEKGEERLAGFAEANEPSPLIDPVMVCLYRDREELRERIDRRVDEMISNGLEKEVRGLMDMGLKTSDISMKGIGYKEVIDAINAGGTAADAAEKIKIRTRQYAKRQMTWFRRYADMHFIKLGDGAGEDAPLKEIVSLMKGNN